MIGGLYFGEYSLPLVGTGAITTTPVTITVDYELPTVGGVGVFLPGPSPQGVEYTFVTYDHYGNQIADFIPVNLAFGRYRNQPGYVNLEVNLRHRYAKKSYVQPDVNDFKLYRNYQVLMGGIVRGVQLDTDSEMLKIAGNEYGIYFDDVVMPFVPGVDQTKYNQHYVNYDLFSAAEGIVQYVLSSYDPNSINLSMSNGLSGIDTTQHFIAADLNTLTDILNTLADTNPGFEYEVTPDQQLFLFTPRKGSRTDFILDLAADEITQVHYETGSIRGSTIYGRGQPATSSVQAVQVFTDPAAQALYRHQDGITDFNIVKNRVQLAGLTKLDLADAVSPLQSLIITYKPTQTNVWNIVDWGDSFRFIADLYYDQIDDYFRILSIEGYCDDHNTEQIVFTMGEEVT